MNSAKFQVTFTQEHIPMWTRHMYGWPFPRLWLDTQQNDRRKDLFKHTVWTYNTAVWENYISQRLRQQVPCHPWSGSQLWWLSMLSSHGITPFVCSPHPGLVLPVFMMGFPTSVYPVWKFPQRHGQRQFQILPGRRPAGTTHCGFSCHVRLLFSLLLYSI